MLTDWLGLDALTELGARFVGQVWPGDTLTARATVTAVRDSNGTSLVDLELVTVNQRGEPVLTGNATARLD
jgi:acyl dehydratase